MNQVAMTHTLLFVDDEANILAALRRLFRPLGYRVLTAESAEQGLDLLRNESVDLVVSDMRMPVMNGARFLELVREGWPDVIRILLTGYAEIGHTIDAINKGQIYRYVTKPWEDQEFCLIVRQALEHRQLQYDKARLEQLTLRQNEELKQLNASLEDRVRARTEELRQTMGFLEKTNTRLKETFVTSVRVFAGLMEMRAHDDQQAGHARRVAELANALAKQLGLVEGPLQDVFLAALLHDIGKMGYADYLLEKPFADMTSQERTEVAKHPVKGEMALMALESLRGAARLIRHHHERFDGQGFPDHLAGLAIPLGARILALANDFDAVQLGTVLHARLTREQAVQWIRDGRGSRYDPTVVDAFMQWVEQDQQRGPGTRELGVDTAKVRPGMVLSRDLFMRSGGLLLARDHVITQDLIVQIRNFEKMENDHYVLFVKAQKGD